MEKKEKKNKGGRPRLQYDPEIAKQVQAMSQYGTPQTEIAELVGVSLVPMRRLYKKELEKGRCVAKLAVRKKLYEACMEGNTACLIFYAKTQLGWREKDGPDMQAVQENSGVLVTPGILNEDEWEKAARQKADDKGEGK